MASIEMFEQFSNDDGSFTFTLNDFNRIIKASIKKGKNKSNKKKGKRPQSAYFIWLGQNRKEIREKYFDDFDSLDNENWSTEFYESYYTEKGLKLPKKINEFKKPKIVALVTSKAGMIWKSLTDEEKKPFEEISDKQKLDYKSSSDCETDENNEVEENTKPKKRRGRPKKSDKQEKVENPTPIENKESENKYGKHDEANNSENDDDDELEVEEYMHEGKQYYINPKNGDIYDPENEETVVVAKIVDGEFKFI